MSEADYPAIEIMKSIYLIFLAVFVLATPLYAGIPLDRIVAVVNDDVILESELQDSIRTIRSQMQQQGNELPPRQELERQVLENLVVTKLQLQMAENSGIRVDDEMLNRAINDIANKNNLSLSEFRRILENDGYNYESFRQKIRQEMIIARLRQRQVENRITVTDVEIDNYLATQEIQGSGETEYRLSHILVAVPDGASEDEREQRRMIAEKILEERQAGREFAELAREFSDSQQAADGGDLGWRKLSEIPSLFSDEVRNMSKGDVSEIVQNDSGFHIFELSDTRRGDSHVVTQTRARHILLRPDELSSEQAVHTRLSQLRERIINDADFGELARAHSDDTVSAVDGGDLGWVNPGDLVPEFQQVMNSLQPGEISQPFKTDFGWHIVQVLDRREHDSTREYRRAQAREAIRKRKTEEAMQNWLREMREEAYVEYRLNE